MTACSVAAPSTTTSPFAAASSRSLAAACTRTGTHIFAGTPRPVKVNTACIIIAHRQLCGSSMHRGSQLTLLGCTFCSSHQHPTSGCHAQGAVDCCSMQQHWPPMAAVQQSWAVCCCWKQMAGQALCSRSVSPKQPEALQTRTCTCCASAWRTTQIIATLVEVSPVQQGREPALQHQPQLTAHAEPPPARWPLCRASLPHQRPAQLRGLHQLLQPSKPGCPLPSWQLPGSALPSARELLQRLRSAPRQTPVQQQVQLRGVASLPGSYSRLYAPAVSPAHAIPRCLHSRHTIPWWGLYRVKLLRRLRSAWHPSLHTSKAHKQGPQVLARRLRSALHPPMAQHDVLYKCLGDGQPVRSCPALHLVLHTAAGRAEAEGLPLHCGQYI